MTGTVRAAWREGQNERERERDGDRAETDRQRARARGRDEGDVYSWQDKRRDPAGDSAADWLTTRLLPDSLGTVVASINMPEVKVGVLCREDSRPANLLSEK